MPISKTVQTIQFKENRWLYRFALLLACMTLCLIFAGGLVTSHEAGLAVPDWPLSYGRLMPPMVGNIFWEHGHRMIAGTVGILTLVLAVWIQIQDERKWMKKLGWVAFGGVVLQALLGGLTVKMLLPPPVSIFHACLAQTFFCLIVAILYFLSPRFKSGKKFSQVYSSANLFLMTAVFIYLQLILGATVRHAHQGIALHIINAFLVLFHIMLSAGRIGRLYGTDVLMRRLGASISFTTLIQIFLGMGAFIFKYVLPRAGYAPSVNEVMVTAVHQTTGAVVLMLSVIIVLIARIR